MGKSLPVRALSNDQQRYITMVKEKKPLQKSAKTLPETQTDSSEQVQALRDAGKLEEATQMARRLSIAEMRSRRDLKEKG